MSEGWESVAQYGGATIRHFWDRFPPHRNAKEGFPLTMGERCSRSLFGFRRQRAKCPQFIFKIPTKVSQKV